MFSNVLQNVSRPSTPLYPGSLGLMCTIQFCDCRLICIQFCYSDTFSGSHFEKTQPLFWQNRAGEWFAESVLKGVTEDLRSWAGGGQDDKFICCRFEAGVAGDTGGDNVAVTAKEMMTEEHESKAGGFEILNCEWALQRRALTGVGQCRQI